MLQERLINIMYNGTVAHLLKCVNTEERGYMRVCLTRIYLLTRPFSARPVITGTAYVRSLLE